MAETIYIDNDNLLRLSGLRNEATGDYINSAVVTVTVIDSGDVNVVGQAWPLTLVYVASSNGRYEGTLEETLVLIAAASYTAVIDAVFGGDLKAHWELPLTAEVRTGTD